MLDNLTWQPMERIAPGADEVEIRVRATGLNFRDVLNTLGLYPGEIGDPGEECSGTIERVGSNVHGLQVGDAVLGMASASFASFTTTHADLVMPIPPGMDFDDAATIPITFLTAWFALERLAHLKQGERVLIHAAAGGVGMAAVQIARRAGAEIYATAGNPEKRAVLQALGVAHVFDSRSLDFADGVMAASAGLGVDVVLNSLSGDFIPRSLDVLAQGGRFLEIGKRDIWTPAQVAERRPDVDYSIVYLGDLSAGEPAAVQAMLRELAPLFAAGELAPLPKMVFLMEEAVSAFRTMAQARHIGKVVVRQPDARAAQTARGMLQLSPSATWLITGGLGGIGLQVAQRLVARGARSLALVGRSAAGEAASEQVRALEQMGAQVRTFTADVGRADDVRRVLAEIAATMPPLRGIVHAAGVVDDGVLAAVRMGRASTPVCLRPSWPAPGTCTG